MKRAKWLIWFNRVLALAALALGIFSIFIHDADKSPIYFLLAFVLWQLD